MKFQIGDKVKITQMEKRPFGQTGRVTKRGTVVDIQENLWGRFYVIEFPNGKRELCGWNLMEKENSNV